MTIIEISGKEHPVAFTMLALDYFCKKHSLTIGDLFKKLQGSGDAEDGIRVPFTFGEVIDLLRYALNEGYRKQGKKTEYTYEQAADLFDEEPTLFERVFTLFAQSVVAKFGGEPGNVQAPNGAAGQAKRKAIAKS